MYRQVLARHKALEKLLTATVAAFFLAIIFIALYIASVFYTRELALFWFLIFIGLSLFLAGLTLAIYAPRILRWQLNTSDYHEWIWKIQGWTDEQIASMNSIHFAQSPRGFLFNTVIWTIVGAFLIFLGTGLFLGGTLNLMYLIIHG